MRYKLLLCIIITLLLVVSGSATTWTRSTEYSRDDVREVTFKNWWGLGATQGTMTLKSHELNEKGEIVTLKTGIGRNVVMYYDFEFNKLINDGLGDVDFIDMRTGKPIERDYKFVYWTTEELERDVCSKYSESLSKNGTIETECSKYIKETYEVKVWKDYNSRNIPKGNIRIGIEVETREKDYIDGIWNIGDKKLTKHASWTSDLETDLVSYYKLDETSGTTATDSHGDNDGTANNARVFTTEEDGIINTCADFTGGKDLIDIKGLLDGVSEGSISIWVKWVGTSQPVGYSRYGPVTARQKDGVWTQFTISLDGANPDTAKIWFEPHTFNAGVKSTTSPGDGVYTHIVVTWKSGEIKIYIDGDLEATSTDTFTLLSDTNIDFTVPAFDNAQNNILISSLTSPSNPFSNSILDIVKKSFFRGLKHE